MKIGFDIDDTITNNREFELSDYIEWCFLTNKKIEISREIFDRTEYDLKKRFHLSDEDAHNFNSYHFPRMVKNVPVMKNAKPLIITLNKFGFDTCIITRRDPNYNKSEYTGDVMVNDTKKWIKKNDIQISEIHFGCNDKLKSCQEFDVDLLFEDSPQNINEVSKEIPVIIPTYPYNIFSVNLNNNIGFTNVSDGYTSEVFDLLGNMLDLSDNETLNLKKYFNNLKE